MTLLRLRWFFVFVFFLTDPFVSDVSVGKLATYIHTAVCNHALQLRFMGDMLP